MPPKKSKVQSKQDDNDVEVRVEQSSMAGVRDNIQELSDLIRSIIREEISVVITKLTTITMTFLPVRGDLTKWTKLCREWTVGLQS